MWSSIVIRNLPFIFGCVCLCASLGARASAWTVTPRGSLAIDTTTVPTTMELSGITYRQALGGSSHQFYAVQDSGNQLVTLSVGLAADGALTSAAATTTKTLTPGYDFEGLALGPAGSVLVAEETTPTIRRYDEATGTSIAALTMPSVFNSSRANFAFESLTRSFDGTTYWTANEEALSIDGPQATTTNGTTVRLQKFSYDAGGTLALGPQFAYNVDPIHIGTTTDAHTRSGLVDLVALPDSSLIALERSLGISGVAFGITFYQYESRIYRITFDGATDISQPLYNAGLVGQTYAPATKTLLWKGQSGGGFGQNMEGLALGPQLPGGNWSLIGVVDDGGTQDLLSDNTLAAFVLAPSLAGDFNGDGKVNSADYVTWRNSLGTVFTQSDFDTWRSHFGVVSTAVATGSVEAVPEPIHGWLSILGVIALFSRCRRHNGLLNAAMRMAIREASPDVDDAVQWCPQTASERPPTVH